jgi:uncharacterized protein (TIGR00369 family)
MAATYPPDEHLLRDLRFRFDEGDDASHAWMPVVPEVCGDDGSVRIGALATLVDVIGGGVAATAANPDWIATADLTLHVVRAVRSGTVEARARVLRAGRTTVVIEVTLHADELDPLDAPGGGTATDDDEIGLATMSFSVLPRRDINPEIAATRPKGPSTMALPDSRMRVPLLDALGVEVIDGAAGRLDVPVLEWAMNSMAAMQGGVVATVVDAAGEVALRAAAGTPLVVTDLQMTYLSFGKVGPIESRVEILAAGPDSGSARVELVDAGADRRRMTVARVRATRPLS